MKRLSLCVFAVCAACLLLTPVALASTKARHFAPDRVRHTASAPRAYARLGADPTYAISGHVLDFGGTPVQGAEVDWGWWAGSAGYQFGGSNITSPSSTGTGADGLFNFAALAGNPGFDDLTIYYPGTVYQATGLWKMDWWSLDFTAKNDTTPFSYDTRPAAVGLHVANAPSPAIEVEAGNANVGFAQTDVTLDGSGDGSASVLPMDTFDDVIAYYYTPLSNDASACRSQVEWLGTPASLSGGATATDVNLDWNAAQHSYLSGRLCQHSGKAGTKVTMVLSGWPQGETASFVGYDEVHGGVAKGSVTSTGADQIYPVRLKIPASAPVGVYEIDTYRTGTAGTPGADSLVEMWDYYQVCTFKPSVSSIPRGHAVRLSGKVPGNGNVTVYSTPHKVSGAPGALAAKGWHRVGTYKTSSGRFSSSLLHPTRTTWYVVKYKGFAFQAFTQVIEVTVH